MTALITKEKIVEKLGISNEVFTYRIKKLAIQPYEHGKYSYYQMKLIKDFKEKKRMFVYKYIKVPVFKTEIEIIKVTETYHIYESKINNYGN